MASAVALPASNVFRGGAAAPTIMNAGADAALTAGTYAGIAGFGAGEGGVENRSKNALSSAATGAAIGGPLGVAGQAVGNSLAGTARNSLAQQADEIGVQIPAFMEGGRASQAVAGKLGALPFVGDDVNAAIAGTRTQAAQAAQGIADRAAGPGVTPQNAGEAVRQSLTDWAGDGARQIQERAYAPVNRAMQNVTAPLTNTRTAAQDLVTQQTGAASPIHQTALREVEEALSRPNGLSFDGLTRLRTRIGQLRDNSIDPNNRTAQAGLGRIYGALTQDMEAAVATQGGQQGQRAWTRANQIARAVAGRRGVISNVVGSQGDKAGEAIVDKIVTLASTKSTANASQLAQIRNSATPEAWQQLSAAAINRLGRNQSNEFSADIFLKNYRQLSDRGRRMLFNTSGRNMIPDLDRLASVAQGLQQFGRLGNPSGTGGVTALLAAITGVGAGDAGATALTMIGSRGLGYAMSRPAVIRPVSRYAQAYNRFQNGRLTRAQLSVAAAQLARAVAGEVEQDPKQIAARIEAVTP
jgi:hypothetical protein